MPWSDTPTLLKNWFGYFGIKKHKARVLVKFLRNWNDIRPKLKVTGKHNNKVLKKMDDQIDEL